MALVHAEYGLPIFVADDGELPQRGAFFATNNKWTLTKIAKVAYSDGSAWKIINKNGWNTSNLVYRADSTNCSSAKRESSQAATTVSPNATAKSAFIALCQRDTKQVDSLPARSFKFPVIWIPDLDKMPLPVERKPHEEPETKPSEPSTVIDSTKADIDVVVDPGKPSSDGSSKPSSGGSGGGSGKGGGVIRTEQKEPLKAGIGPFVLIGGGILAILGTILWPVSDGPKRKKKR